MEIVVLDGRTLNPGDLKRERLMQQAFDNLAAFLDGEYTNVVKKV